MNRQRHLSSLKRGLSALTMINHAGRVTAAELARHIRVPRATAHRILNTLMDEGYVARAPHTHSYQLTIQVRRLAFGFSRDDLIAEVARPVLRQLCEEMLAPVGLATPVGRDVVIQVSMDFASPLALNRLPEGTSFPVTHGPSGHLFLAHCSPELREQLIESAPYSPSAGRLKIRQTPVQAELDQILQDGYAISINSDPRFPEGVIAVPIYLDSAYVGSIHLRFMKRLYSRARALERFLHKMNAASAEIAISLKQTLHDDQALYGQMDQPLFLSSIVDTF